MKSLRLLTALCLWETYISSYTCENYGLENIIKQKQVGK